MQLRITLDRRHGFSLMELMIAIAIIGILAAVAIPSYQTYTRRAHYSQIVQAVSIYKIGVEECFQYTSDLTQCSAEQNGVPANASPNSGLIQAINTTNGIITVTPNNKYGIKSTDTYELIPKVASDQLIWSTAGGAIKAGYVK